jgi:succinylglutamate desuccinylase
MYQILSAIPDGLLDARPEELKELLGGPTLIHLEGRRRPALFLSVLLHGNEPSGFLALCRMLRRYKPGGGSEDLPRSLSIFIGNVRAAEKNVRRLEGQPDYNRVWPGSPAEDSPEKAMMANIVASMRDQGVFASVDSHNTTGPNPHYACINSTEVPFLHLATLFSRTIVYFGMPPGVQTMAFAKICPSVTLECGQAGDERGVAHAAEYMDACLHLSRFPDAPVPPHDYELFHTVARVTIPEEVTFGFNGEDVDIRFREDLDRMNFTEVEAGTLIAEIHGDGVARLKIENEEGEILDDRYLRYEGGNLTFRTTLMPSMLNHDSTIIRQDCLCYLMERYWPGT